MDGGKWLNYNRFFFLAVSGLPLFFRNELARSSRHIHAHRVGRTRWMTKKRRGGILRTYSCFFCAFICGVFHFVEEKSDEFSVRLSINTWDEVTDRQI